MKFKGAVLTGVSLMILCLSACNSSNVEEQENTEVSSKEDGNKSSGEEEMNLVQLDGIKSGWINFEGELKGSKDYVVTSNIEYDSASEYKLSHGAYVSYFEGDQFIKTVLQNEAGPIENVENAKTIKLSFHKSFKEVMKLSKQ